jgi:hypothetical protein
MITAELVNKIFRCNSVDIPEKMDNLTSRIKTQESMHYALSKL